MSSPKTIVYFLVLSFFTLLISCSTDNDNEPETVAVDNDNSDEDDGDEDNNGDGDGNNINGSCEEGKTPIFIEKDGILTIEIEKSDFENTSWSMEESIEGFSGDGYLVWTGDNLFRDPGSGLLTYKIRISTPGTYRFIWRSNITIGDDNTEHNDSWLRIPDANHFYGLRNDGHIVYPKGTTLDPIPESEGQESTEPEGAGKDGWFKIFMNNANSWEWRSATSDNDGHNIYVIFDAVGDYTIEISGRSTGHGIDKMVLFTDTTTPQNATDNNTTVNDIKCE